ncbi:MAG: metal-sensitive transcriptional regulator [Ectothiorhodospiraceae bacterium]|jgi:DNA-binding FrmR family transcriptional regulator
MTSELELLRQKQQKALLARLARIEGQVRGIRRMIEHEESCENVAQQLAAARKAMNKCFYEMMACAIRQEVMPAGEVAPRGEEKLEELTKVLSKYG